MKLSKEQIAQIDETLVSNKVVYDDVKLELTDHIASDIEGIMSDKSVSFEEAFKDAFEKWERKLVLTSNAGWLGFFVFSPKLVVDKMVSYSKRQMTLIFISAFIFGTLMSSLVTIYNNDKFFNILKFGLTSLFLLIGVTTIFLIFLIWKSNHKTTYGRLFLLRGCLTFSYFYLFNLYNKNQFLLDASNSFLENFLAWILYGFAFFYSFFQIIMAFEHFKTVKKYRLI